MVRERSVLTEAEEVTVRNAVGLILAHPIFRASERCSKLFRYLADHALAHDDEVLKERRLGHEVFGREIGYDTADDPVVRNAASDTRKRLRQYDAENGSGLLVRILLAQGAYALDFAFRDSASPIDRPEPDPALLSIGPVPEAYPPAALWKTERLPWFITLVATVACLLFAGAYLRQRQQIKAAAIPLIADDPLWSPMLNSGKEIFVSLGHAQSSPADPSHDVSLGLQRITITDLKAFTNISTFLTTHHQNFQMRTDNQTTLLDLRERPTVLIGIQNNQWSLRLTSGLRFHFDHSEAQQGRVDRIVSLVDSAHPGQSWQVHLGANPSDSDYAIAGRLLDPVTGGLILYVAGAGTVGTEAASEFVTQPRFLKTLPSSLRDPKANIQVVIRTPILGGVPGTPEVVATNIY